MLIDLATEAEAHEMNRADKNAARTYHAARPVDLDRWLSSPDAFRAPLDSWTKARRIRQMRTELAGRETELAL